MHCICSVKVSASCSFNVPPPQHLVIGYFSNSGWSIFFLLRSFNIPFFVNLSFMKLFNFCAYYWASLRIFLQAMLILKRNFQEFSFKNLALNHCLICYPGPSKNQDVEWNRNQDVEWKRNQDVEWKREIRK